MDNRIQNSARAIVRVGVIASLVVLGGVASAEGQKEETAKESTLELNAEHLGKSREALGSENAVIEDAEDEESEMKEKAERRHGKKHGRKHGNKHGNKHGKKHHDGEGCDETCKARHHGRKAVARSYERCVEVSVQANNSLDESSRVCRVLFPEKES